jgi:hypothetical protein
MAGTPPTATHPARNASTSDDDTRSRRSGAIGGEPRVAPRRQLDLDTDRSSSSSASPANPSAAAGTGASRAVA